MKNAQGNQLWGLDSLDSSAKILGTPRKLRIIRRSCTTVPLDPGLQKLTFPDPGLRERRLNCSLAAGFLSRRLCKTQ